MTGIYCAYHPLYRICESCGKEMARSEVRLCVAVTRPIAASLKSEKIHTLREVRALIQSNAQSTWKSGQIDRSDAITDLLVEFDRRFPEGREPW